MASISLTIPTDQLSRVVHALCAATGQPESAANAKKAVVEWVKTTVANVERTEAEQARPAITEPDVTAVAS